MATTARVEVVVIGVGKPNFSMGWLHLQQLLAEPDLAALCDVVGVVEPFYLSEAGRQAAGSAEFQEYMAAHPQVAVVDTCAKLPACDLSRRRLAVLAVRVADTRRLFEEAISAGCSAVYLEKPGAASASELQEIITLAEAKGIAVMTGYSRNMEQHVKRAMQKLQESGAETSVTLLHSNPWKEEEMAQCFHRCRPGMLYDMACHDLALAVALFGLRAGEWSELEVQEDKCSIATYDSIQDFVRLHFSLRTMAAADNKLSFYIDRCAGAFNGLELKYSDSASERFLCGEPPVAYSNPLPQLSPHLAVAYSGYVEAKLALLQAVQAGSKDFPPEVPTVEVARQVFLLAEELTVALTERLS